VQYRNNYSIILEERMSGREDLHARAWRSRDRDWLHEGTAGRMIFFFCMRYCWQNDVRYSLYVIFSWVTHKPFGRWIFTPRYPQTSMQHVTILISDLLFGQTTTRSGYMNLLANNVK
jgi:hypothetical protein